MNELNNCPLQPYCPDDCKACTDEIKAEKINNVTNALMPALQSIIDALMPTIEEAARTVTELWRCIMESYPNKRVVHLALYHPKAKVRKKNVQRIMRWLERE
jgi:hypothetical protein